jgi:hypothetical protein
MIAMIDRIDPTTFFNSILLQREKMPIIIPTIQKAEPHTLVKNKYAKILLN